MALELAGDPVDPRALVLASLALGACGGVLAPSYDRTRLAAAETPDAVKAQLPGDLLAEAGACASGGAPDTLAEARAVHQVCDLGELASEDDFAMASGDRMLAAQAFLFLRERDGVEARRVGRILLGPPILAADADPPSISGLEPREIGDFVRVDAPIAVTGDWGPFPYWHLDEYEGVRAVLIDKDLDVGTLRYVLASAGRDVQVIVRSDTVTSVSMYASIVEGTPSGMGRRAEVGEVSHVRPPDDMTVQALLEQVAAEARTGILLAIDMPYAPCGDAPGPNMRCVPGGDGIGTFWIDVAPTSDTKACYARGACRSVPGTWRSARELCSYLGKRLPTSFEVQRAGVGGEPMWTATWEGDAPPPRGVCDGSPYCNATNRKLLTDASPRVHQQPLRAPVICATDKPWRTAWPSMGWDHVLPEPPLPEPDPDGAAAANRVRGDVLSDKGVCGEEVRATWIEELRRGGRSTTECRDPQSYVTSNEPDRYLFGRLIRNQGGGYVGVGSDQAYDFIAAARSEWAWVYDYDPNVIRLHRVSQPLLRAAETREAYIALWADPERAHPLIEAAYDEADAGVLIAFYNGWRSRLHRHYTRQLEGYPELPEFGWLATDRNYTWIRTLALQERIVPTPVDLLGTTGMRSIGQTARGMGVPVRVFYTSNAPTAWGGQATPDYKKNVLALPFDDQTRVIATTNKGGFDQEGRWHYNVMDGLLFQQRMASDHYRWNHQPMWDRIPGDHGNLTVLGLPMDPAVEAP